METLNQMDKETLERAQKWTQAPFDETTQKAVQQMIDHDPTAATDSFYKDLEFGTGGLRGVMGPGTNRMNVYTIGQATQGLANYLNQSFPGQEIKVAIAHDSRNNGPLFAKNTAEILAANGCTVYLFDALRPTPELSFAVRHLGCQSGIVITASHNPPEYNGYKVYWEDGAQLVAPHDTNVIDEVRKVEIADIKFDGGTGKVINIGEDVDKAYLDAIQGLSLSRFWEKGGQDLPVVFTNLHGTAITLLPKALENFGFNNVHIVPEQAEPDGNFPTVKSPNPEESDALAIAIEQAKANDAELVLATDPDADRVGIAVKDLDGNWTLLNGNQTGSVLIYYLLENWKQKGFQGNEFVVKTIVTSNLIAKIAEGYGVEHFETLTGFKFIAELIRKYEGEKVFIGGGEESYGYLIGDLVRDKDAVMSAVMIAEAAGWAKDQGKSFFEVLLDIYTQYGLYKEQLVSITKKGKAGAEEIAQMMTDLRNNPPSSVGGVDVELLGDYKAGTIKNLTTGEVSATGMVSSNVIQLTLSDGSKITARPSGTEPKIKFYVSVVGQLNEPSEYNAAVSELEQRIGNMLSEMGWN